MSEKEYIRQGPLADWLKEFADSELKKDSKQSNPLEDIKNIFNKREEGNAVEARVEELRSRVGLDIIEKKADLLIGEKEDKRSERIKRLMALADIDEMMAKDKEENVLEKNPKLKIFIDNICQSRGGHVDLPSILKMVRDERPEEVDIKDPGLIEYIEDKIKSSKKEIEDIGDNVAGMAVMIVTDEEDDGNKEVFSKPAKV